MAEDQEKIERIKSNLRSYLNAQPSGPDAEQAKRILVNLQANAPSLPSPRAPSESMSDVDLGIESGPRVTYDSTAGAPGTRSMALPGGSNEASMHAGPAPRAHETTELEGDPIAQEIVGQAMTMPLLHVAGLGMSSLGRKLMEPAASKFANTVMDVDRDAIVKGGSMAGEKVGAALDKIERMKTAAPERASFLDAEKEKILNGAMSAAPDASTADMGMLGHLLPLVGHGPTGLALRAAAAAPAAAGDLAGRGLIRAGQGMAMPLSLAGNPLLQAATGRE